MKTPIEQLTETNAAQAAEIVALKAKIKSMEEEKKDDPPEETEEEKKKREEDEEAARKAAEEEEKKDEADKVKAIKDLGDKVKALSAFIRSPEFRASVVPGSASGVSEGGSDSGGKTMTKEEASAAYNKIDPNDAKARAQFRADHKSELGL
jgi:hypothetical protein